MAKVIELTKGFVAIVDDTVYRRAKKHSWHVHHSRGNKKKPGQPYARATIKGKKVYLHRFVMDEILKKVGGASGLHIDHKNHQTLDNRADNLEAVDPKTNNHRRRYVKKLIRSAS